MKHRCPQMQRDEEARSVIGQAAWIYYQKWMKVYRRIVPKQKTFVHSRFFNSFIRFAKHVKQVRLPDVDSFIWLMKEKDISPTLWTNDQVYALYLEFLDRKGDPRKFARITINMILKVADAADCETSEFFDVLQPNEIIELLRQRRLSPWILLHSKRFAQFYVSSTTPEQRVIMESIIRPDYWQNKFQQNPKIVNLMRKYVAELDL